MFWKKKKIPTTASPGENRIDALANRLQQAGQIDRLEKELLQFDRQTLSDPEKETWYHLYGIVPFRSGNRALAFERFREGMEQCPDSAMLVFSLGQEYEYKRQAENMFECFDKAVFPKVPAMYALAQARYAYLWNRTDKARKYINPIMDVYFDLKILDDTFLYIRGLPFFSQTWAYLAAFSALEKNFDQLTSLTARAAAECHDFDFETLELEFRALKANDFTAVRAKLQQTIQQTTVIPNGYDAMRLGVLLAQEAKAKQEATEVLNSVTLKEDGFPWLNDIRLLAQCEISHKWGDLSEEASLCKDFFSRQPMLFEPDHALNFNLIKYQESLKLHYQTREL